MMPDTGGKPGSNENDPEHLSRLIDLELAQKRVAWKEGASRRQKIRVASFLFLFLLIIASLLAFFVLSTRVNQERANPRATPTPAGSQH
jgi:hypothetical protein